MRAALLVVLLTALAIWGAEPRPFVRDWKEEELAPELGKLTRERDLERGKNLFREICSQCHRAGSAEAGDIGPDLAETTRKLAAGRTTPADLLRDVLRPSAAIDAKYRTLIVTTRRGDVLTGVVVSRREGVLTLRAGPREKPRDVREADIEERTEAKVSLMPEGLLSVLTKDEILDLLAFVAVGEKPPVGPP